MRNNNKNVVDSYDRAKIRIPSKFFSLSQKQLT